MNLKHNRYVPSHIIVKPLKTKGKRKISKEVIRKSIHYTQRKEDTNSTGTTEYPQIKKKLMIMGWDLGISIGEGSNHFSYDF